MSVPTCEHCGRSPEAHHVPRHPGRRTTCQDGHPARGFTAFDIIEMWARVGKPLTYKQEAEWRKVNQV